MTADPARPHGKNLRRGRVSLPGQIYHITAVTLDRAPVFCDLRNARPLINSLHQAQVRDEASTLVFVVMPDHFHWLMQLGEDQSLSQVVRTVKVVTSHQLGKGVWQKGFHDHALRSDEDLAGVARYIVANPCAPGWSNAWGITRIGMLCGCRSDAPVAIQQPIATRAWLLQRDKCCVGAAPRGDSVCVAVNSRYGRGRFAWVG